jgi:hypothetical protein
LQTAIRIARLRASGAFHALASYHKPLQFQCFSGGSTAVGRLSSHVMFDHEDSALADAMPVKIKNSAGVKK